MKKFLIATAIIASQAAAAQTLYVNNSNGTYQAIDTKESSGMTFDAQARTVRFGMPGGVYCQFATERIDNISLATDKNTALTYTLAPEVKFNAEDSIAYNEITETIPDDELHEDYGDFVENYSVGRVITITFSETGVKTSSLPSDIKATINGGHITIDSERSKVAYRVTGSCSNGSLKIYSQKKFQIMLMGLTLTNPGGPALNIQSGKTVYMTIADGTTNTLCDGTTYNAPVIGSTGEEEDQKGTLFSEGQLVFNGSGTLNVTSLGGHAICSDDYIRVRSGNFNLTSSTKDGFRTKDKFIISRTASASPAIKIYADSNGIECSEGEVVIEAGKIDITSGGEAIKVEYEEAIPDPAVTPNATIRGGYIKIKTTGEKSSAIQTTGNYTHSGGIIQATVAGNGSKIVNCDGNATFTNGMITAFASGSVASDSTSAGGIKCEGELLISGGTISIECTGRGSKGINCDSDIIVNGGTLTLLAEAENYTGIADDKKSRAITTNNITIDGGTLVLSAYDHAISATGIYLNEGIVNALSTTTGALDIEAVQTGGWLVTKDAE